MVKHATDLYPILDFVNFLLMFYKAGYSKP